MNLVATAEATIDRPREGVAAFVIDNRNNPIWIGWISESELESEPPIRMGSRVRRVSRDQLPIGRDPAVVHNGWSPRPKEVASMTAIDEIVYLLDEAFSGTGIEETNESQSLLVNLGTVEEAQWHEIPTGGVRTIASVALHVGTCKVMYDEYAFGPGRLRWDDPGLEPWPKSQAPMADTIVWLKEAHARFVDHVRTLRDDELGEPRLANWGEAKETRWLIGMLLEHDTYHAGEINHIRSLLAADDGWRWG